MKCQDLTILTTSCPHVLIDPMILFAPEDRSTVYTIVTTTSERGAWDKEGNYAPIPVTQHSIYDGDKMVQFAFDEQHIAQQVKHYEMPGFDDPNNIMSSRFD